ncbi:helix-turn-helix domain-containing protein [Brevundimonas nasdae]|uniref:helix-turn-helix domain-containing protein n=1 Tax=Brevundimonas nasdae TaxID=172043 RepID=UPI003F68CD1D
MTSKSIPAREVFAQLPEEERLAGEALGRAAVEAYTLRQVRDAVSLTQAEVAKAARTSQDQVSRTERREDLMVSSLEKHIAALGGKLKMLVEIPGRTPITLSLKGGRPVNATPAEHVRKTASA